MRCYHCGQEIEDTARHCMYCGTNQRTAPAAMPEVVLQPTPAQQEEPNVQPLDQQAEQEAPRLTEWEEAPVCTPPVVPAQMTIETPVVPVAAPVESPAAPAAVAVPAGTKVIYVQGAQPALKLATNRSLTKMFFLGLVTFGIYNMVIYCKMATDLNVAASRYDGRRTMPYLAMCYLAPLTLFVLPWVWIHNLCDRIKVEMNRRDIDYKFGPATFWLWNVLGSLILVGPFIFIHKLMKAMNLICEDFNKVG